MARGYPDYFGRSIWPKYGTAHSKIGTSLQVPSLETVEIFSLTGMGVLKWLKATAALQPDYGSSFFRLTVDNAVIDTLKFYSGHYTSGVCGGSSLWGIVVFDLLLNDITAETSIEIPFHDGVVIDLYNASASAVAASGSAMYYIVT